MKLREASPQAAPVADNWVARSHVQALVLIVATAVGIYVCCQLVLPFLPALVWALALAVLFTPLHRRLESKLKHPSLAAAITVLIVGLIVAVPGIFVGQRLIMESARGAQIVQVKVESGEWRRAIEAQPRLVPLETWMEQEFDLPGAVRDLASWLTKTAGSIVRGSVVQLLGFALTFYLLFYFLRDRRAALLSLRSMSPLSPEEMDRLFARIGDTVFATVYGTLAVAAVQGLLGGLMFWWLGLPTPLLWGVIMGLLAVVPVLGAFVVWIPAAIFLLLDGSWGKALILTAWGGVVVGGIDNLLYPMLVGGRLKMHTVLAFISVVGGLMVFGPSGLVLGPVALTITTEILAIWRNRNSATTAARVADEQLADPGSEVHDPAPV